MKAKTLEEALRRVFKEDVQKHDELNPKLWDNDSKTLLPEVAAKLAEIKDAFVDYAHYRDLKDVTVKDAVIVGSNANYNYTEDSDLDLHLIIDDSKDCSEKHLLLIYDFLRSLFNDKYDIKINGIDTEIYVEAGYLNTKNSGGVYSLKNGWINEPKEAIIPDIDKAALNKELQPWLDKANALLNTDKSEDITKYIDDIYNLRKESIQQDGEFGFGNLIFKEVRNAGLLDALRDAQDALISKSLSLN